MFGAFPLFDKNITMHFHHAQRRFLIETAAAYMFNFFIIFC